MLVLSLFALFGSMQIKKVGALSFTSTGSVDGNNTFECHANITLNCKSDSMATFYLNVNGSQAVACIVNCFVITQNLGNYTTSHDASTRLINLYMTSIRANDKYTTFSCQEGAELYSIHPNIKVFPRKGSAKMSINVTNNYIQIVVTTGCYLLQNNVSFKWEKIKANSNLTIEDFTENEINQTNLQDNSHCDAASNCGATSMFSIVSFTQAHDNTGEGYYIQCTIIVTDDHAPGNVVLVSDSAFLIEGKALCNKWWCLPCCIFGAILGGIFLVAIILVVFVKGLCSNGKLGSLQYWELFAVLGVCAVLISLIVIIAVAGVCQDCSRTKRDVLDCWIIYIIILGIFVTFVFVCTIIYIGKERIDSLKVVSRRVNGKKMVIKIEWNSRLHKCKTFHIELNTNTVSRQLDYTIRKDGFLESEITDLNLDSNFIAKVYSTMCFIQSQGHRLDFNTRGVPSPPSNVFEDETCRTESSVTLNWTHANGPKPLYIIKYQRSKGKKRDWMYTEKINDTKYTLDGLKPGTSYTIIIKAENEIGSSEESKPLFVKTRALRPIPPEDFRCISVKESEVILSWKPSKNMKKQQFILTVYNTSEEKLPGQNCQDTQIRIPNTGKKVMTYQLTKLKPRSRYMFELFTLAGKLLSERSAIATVETEDRSHVEDDVLCNRNTETSVFYMKHT